MKVKQVNEDMYNLTVTICLALVVHFVTGVSFPQKLPNGNSVNSGEKYDRSQGMADLREKTTRHIVRKESSRNNDGLFRLVRYDRTKNGHTRTRLVATVKVQTSTPRTVVLAMGKHKFARPKYKPYKTHLSKGRKEKPERVTTAVTETYGGKWRPRPNLWKIEEDEPKFPANHNPVYSGISDYCNLLEKYRAFREKHSGMKGETFDYGINEYLNLIKSVKSDEPVRRRQFSLVLT